MNVKECEIIASPMVMRHDRFLHFDFLHPLTQTPYAMLIPGPKAAGMNIEAIWKPFQPSVNCAHTFISKILSIKFIGIFF